MQIALSVVVVCAVVAMIALPLIRRVDESGVDHALETIEIAKQAKYREIRDAELDFRAGKLTKEDWRATDSELRIEAAEILEQASAAAADRPSAEKPS